MTAVFDAMSLDNPAFKALLFYEALLIFKMMAMSVLTAMQRMKNKAFANPEDAASMKLKPKVHEDVERVRRAHLNDLENILIFFVASWLYLLTQPNAAFATMLFRIYTIARYAHTLVYAVVVVPQPARGIAWFVGYGITGYMAATAALHFF
ncbi:Microsomal glutathione S-transferase-like [Carabus blaptoides fortunei]